ncbi:hypothetical protein HK099_006461 [Clydaea vesicula]|uniref:Cytochrome P450 n=1 Tax=Clydaea vesicula TaxID=447962 RepID=A0AAD5XZ24_9FUNG|nr:hypothetical protein HK099_006461 [Clydaea vesicula]
MRVFDLTNSELLTNVVIIVGVPVVLFCVAAAVTLTFFHVNTRTSKIHLKTPTPQPIVGNLLQLSANRHRKHDWILDNFRTLKTETFAVLIPTPFLTYRPDLIMTANVKNVEHILKTNFVNYEKGFLFRENLSCFLGSGIFTVDGSSWKSQRKIASHIFTVKNVCILIAFGCDFGCLETPDNPLPFASAFDRVQGIVCDRFINPFWFITEFFTGERIELNKNLDIVNTFAKEMIVEARKRNLANDHDNNEDVSKNDLLDFFLESKNEDGTPLKDSQLRDVVLNFIIAGRDTTAQALSWGIWEICKNPVVEEKLLKEAKAVIRDKKFPNYEEVKELKYSQAVFYEILRLYPSVPANLKLAVNDDVLPDGTLIPAGSVVSMAPYSMGRLESIWGKDAEEFNPSRWFDISGNLIKESSSKFPAFHSGPRTCLGQHLATHEAITVLSTLVRDFHFELLPNQDITYGDSLTLPMKNPLLVKVCKRQ